MLAGSKKCVFKIQWDKTKKLKALENSIMTEG